MSICVNFCVLNTGTLCIEFNQNEVFEIIDSSVQITDFYCAKSGHIVDLYFTVKINSAPPGELMGTLKNNFVPINMYALSDVVRSDAQPYSSAGSVFIYGKKTSQPGAIRIYGTKVGGSYYVQLTYLT